MSIGTLLPEPRIDQSAAFADTDLIREYLDQQRDLTAVERFAQFHAESKVPAQAQYYRDLIPDVMPGPGQQFAFEVDLDRCQGCKACVAACHNLNGLDEGETWRTVGILAGTANSLPLVQHVTTACHHCLDPGCMAGCPVQAYEKDTHTGVVKHLDDQCIGCQYCTMTCPYEVPQYHEQKGIVRKCSMCHERLAVGEAPACVQGCPTSAIQIKIVSTNEVRTQWANGNRLLPTDTVPNSRITNPTTTYKSGRHDFAVAPGDFGMPKIQHGHLPLAAMLTLTQSGVGVIVAGVILTYVAELLPQSTMVAWATIGGGLAIVGMHAALLHLGRPLYAFRAFLGWRTSWLSREIMTFGVFAAVASTWIAFLWLPTILSIPILPRSIGQLPESLALPSIDLLAVATSAIGILAVTTSVMIYVVTRRPAWSFAITSAKFYGTAAVVAPFGIIVALQQANNPVPMVLSLFAIVASGFRLLTEWYPIVAARTNPKSLLLDTAVLLTGPLRAVVYAATGLMAAAGILLPSLAIASSSFNSTLTVLALVSVIIAEFMFRYLYFASGVGRRMPGVPQ